LDVIKPENLFVLDSIAAATFVIDSEQKVICWNKACESLTGVKAEEVMNTSDHWKGFYSYKRPCLADLVFDDNWQDNLELYHHIKRAKFSSRGLHAENWCQTPNGNMYLIFDANAIFDTNGNVIGVIETLRDATPLIKTQQELQKLIIAVEKSPAATYITDAQHIIEYVNPKYTDLTGYTKDELLGLNIKNLSSNIEDDNVQDEMFKVVKKDGQWSGMLSMKRKDKTEFWANTRISSVMDSDGNISNYIGIKIDFTKEYELQNELKYKALHDGLTSLINRREFDNRVKSILNGERDEVDLNVICFIDLDNFKAINDNLGHDAGDNLLIDVANILKNNVRNNDSAARLGGDEFSVLLRNCTLENANRVINNIYKEIQELEVRVNNPQLKFGASIGVYEFDNYTLTIEEIMKKADMACYEAKGKGRNCIHVYSELDMNEEHRKAV
jgi:diguanylate cyclase (GGDEF)-like protein/PAS domain S-box-containing protein